MSLEALKSVTKAGMEFLRSESSSNFPILRLLENKNVHAILDWITSLNPIEVEQLFKSIELQARDAPTYSTLSQLQLAPVGPRFKFPQSKAFLEKLKNNSSDFDFDKCDSESIVAISHLGNYKILTTVCASSRLFNIECHHTIYNPEGIFTSYTMSRATGIYHGDRWKSENLDLEISLDQVSKVLKASYGLLKSDLQHLVQVP
jgi:hypothetical protein